MFCRFYFSYVIELFCICRKPVSVVNESSGNNLILLLTYKCLILLIFNELTTDYNSFLAFVKPFWYCLFKNQNRTLLYCFAIIDFHLFNCFAFIFLLNQMKILFFFYFPLFKSSFHFSATFISFHDTWFSFKMFLLLKEKKKIKLTFLFFPDSDCHLYFKFFYEIIETKNFFTRLLRPKIDKLKLLEFWFFNKLQFWNIHLCLRKSWRMTFWNMVKSAHRLKKMNISVNYSFTLLHSDYYPHLCHFYHNILAIMPYMRVAYKERRTTATVVSSSLYCFGWKN